MQVTRYKDINGDNQTLSELMQAETSEELQAKMNSRLEELHAQGHTLVERRAATDDEIIEHMGPLALRRQRERFAKEKKKYDRLMKKSQREHNNALREY